MPTAVPANGAHLVDPPDLQELLKIALDAAGQAATLLVDKRPDEVHVAATKSSPTDIVTEMDNAAERLIVDLIKESRPGDGVRGEEGADEAGTTRVRWLVDPIDGTVNYLYGLPGWSVSIGAEVHGQVQAGVVAIPTFGETYTAVLGGGAYRNGERVRCNPAPDLGHALVGTGFGYEVARRVHQAEVIAELLSKVRDIRRIGSCAGDLCAVASGRLDAYFERGPQPWDLAAGVLIAREAGARVEGLRGRPPSEDMALAAPTGLFEPLHDLLVAVEADRD
jgi:myo-inositol-1(or 4)-monophosphatase